MAKDKITYVLGAGASIGTFPLIRGTKEWEEKGLADILELEGNKLKNSNLGGKEYDSTLLKIADAMLNTGENAKTKSFGDVDSYAKYLYYNEIRKLPSLKLALTYYFVRQQICKHYLPLNKESRYLNFISNLLDDRGEFPENIKILSWNYDFLLQVAAMKFKSQKSPSIEQNGIPQTPFISYFPWLGMKEKNQREYSLMHLNGIAGFYLKPHDNSMYPFGNIIIELMNKYKEVEITESDLLFYFHEKLTDVEYLVTFAWEIQSYYRQHVDSIVRAKEMVSEIVKGTNILVVIGYSFPNYNKEFDKIIFDTIEPTLRKIYFQAPDGSENPLKERFDIRTKGEKAKLIKFGTSMREFPIVDIKDIHNTDRFHIVV